MSHLGDLHDGCHRSAPTHAKTMSTRTHGAVAPTANESALARCAAATSGTLSTRVPTPRGVASTRGIGLWCVTKRI